VLVVPPARLPTGSGGKAEHAAVANG
jgi:hypothetical protein